MVKLTLVTVILGVLSMSMGSSGQLVQTIDIIEAFGRALKLGGESQLCLLSSCAEDNVEKATQVVCDIVPNLRKLKNFEPLSLLSVAFAFSNGVWAAEPKCRTDTSYRGCTKEVPEQLTQLAELSIHASDILGRLRNLSAEDQKKAGKLMADSALLISNGSDEGLTCVDDVSRVLGSVVDNMEKLLN